jgi:hypothetical protein
MGQMKLRKQFEHDTSRENPKREGYAENWKVYFFDVIKYWRDYAKWLEQKLEGMK